MTPSSLQGDTRLRGWMEQDKVKEKVRKRSKPRRKGEALGNGE